MLLGNLHWTKGFPVILNKLGSNIPNFFYFGPFSGVLGELLYLGISEVRSLNPRFSLIPQLCNDEKI